eukprot:scaffold73900_cov59-Phaeocystis_antarctica.AAC.1
MTLFYITVIRMIEMRRQMGAKRGAAPSKARSPVLMRPSGKLISVSEAHSILVPAPGRKHFVSFLHPNEARLCSSTDQNKQCERQLPTRKAGANSARADIFKLYFSWKGSIPHC